MTYIKQVREYCENHKGTIIDVSKVKDEEFAEIPYKTLLKILNRLEEEKIVTSVSKGVYSIGKLKSGSQPNVLKQYVGNGRGMVFGYMLYNSMGISNYHPLITEIYTNAMSSAHKNIENYHLTKVNLEFTDEVIEFIVLLELLKDFCNIKACNVLKLDSAVSTLLNRYSDELFEKVIKAKDYPFSVITMLEKTKYKTDGMGGIITNGTMVDYAKKRIKEVRNTLLGFDEINRLNGATPSTSAASCSSGSRSKVASKRYMR